MKHITRNCVALTFLAASATLGANAADAEGAWDLGEKDGKSFLHTVTEAGPSLTLSCSDKVGIRATVFLKGNSIDELETASDARPRARRVSVDTSTTDPRSGAWAYVRTAGKLISTKSWQGKRLYNAAITGSPVTMDVFKVGEMTLALPGVDENFTSFASSCDATS